MKITTAIFVIGICACSTAFAATKHVDGYTRKDGTYVSPHIRTTPDNYRSNNLGSQTFGGSQRDEYSSGMGATNRSNSSYGWRDNDNDGMMNRYDRTPEGGNGYGNRSNYGR